MFDIGWSELLVIGVVALVVIGPKDLPKALRTAGALVRKARNISRDFQSSVEQMVREAELDEVKKEVQKAASVDLEKEFRQTIDPKGELEEALKPPEFPTPEIVPDEKPSTPEISADTPPAALPSPSTPDAPPQEAAETLQPHASDTPQPAKTGT
jgi:sec-independent protein translocase protein TatB